MNYIIKYGELNNMIDISEYCLNRMFHNNLLLIPKNDIMMKQILRKNNENPDNIIVKDTNLIHIYENNNLIYENTHNLHICIDFEVNMMYIGNFPEHVIKKILQSSFFEHKLWYIQSNIKLNCGHFYEEYPEQLFVTKYLTGNEKVLELGGNIGRNSMIIAYILNKCNNNNFVTLETNSDYCNILKYQRDNNNLEFHIENSALSKRELIQRDWITIPSNDVLSGWSRINTITYNELLLKYTIEFDTLVIDCEGAFFQILLDMGELLKNIKLIIMENDYTELWQKQCVDYILKLNGFSIIDSLPLGFRIDWVVCQDNFYEVWKK
jgi:FkbM family methyltransferase